MSDASPTIRGAAPQAARARHPRLVLATCILASSLAFIDSSVINVGLPAIRRGLGADPGALQWVVDGYILPLAALILLGGAAGDRFGRRFLLIGGIALFGLASLACGAAPGSAALIAARFAQGVGAAMLMPNSLALLSETFAGPARGRAIGIWASVGAAGAAVGPLVGGALIALAGWRAVFLVNLPIALAAVLLAWRTVPRSIDRRGESRLDGAGAALATLGLGAVSLALTVGVGHGGWTPLATGALCGGLLSLAGFVVVEHRRGARAMMPLDLFGSREFVSLTLLTVLLYGAIGQVFVLLPWLLIDLAHYRAATAGAALLPLPALLGTLSPRAGSLAGRIGAKPLLVGGAALGACAMLLMCRIGPEAEYWSEVLPALLVMGVGISGAVAPLTGAVLGAVDAAHAGAASGMNSAAARTGTLFATALVGGVLASHGAALAASFHHACLVAAGACLLAALCGLLLPGHRRG